MIVPWFAVRPPSPSPTSLCWEAAALPLPFLVVGVGTFVMVVGAGGVEAFAFFRDVAGEDEGDIASFGRLRLDDAVVRGMAGGHVVPHFSVGFSSG